MVRTWNGPAYSVDYLWWRFPEVGVLYSVLFLSILPITPGKAPGPAGS